jgi:hypothetical protein
MKRESLSQEATRQAAELRDFARMRVEGVGVDRRMIYVIALARLLADAEDDIAEGRTRSFRLFFDEFYKKS